MLEKLKRVGSEYVDETDCWWDSKASYLQIEVLGLCGCGTPDAAMEYIYNNLKRFDDSDKGFAEHGSSDDMPYMFFCYWANDKGFAEHGGSVQYSYLTEKGKELVKDIETVMNENVE